MKHTNLYYAIVGFISYNKQAKELGVEIKPTKDNLIDTIIVEDKELSIHCIPDINEMGIGFCALTKIWNKPYVLVDDRFLVLPEAIQQAMIMHEIGHLIHGNLNRSFKDIYEQFVYLGKLKCSSEEESNLLVENVVHTRDYSDEIQADQYAAQVCGADAVIAKLRCYATMFGITPEIRGRFKAIAGYEMEQDSRLSLMRSINWDDITVVSLETLEEGGEE